MPERTGEAEWKGSLRDGAGRMKLGSGAFDGPYSFGSRFADGKGTNPEEMIAAAHAGCFSMALALGLGQAGFTPTRIHTKAATQIEQTDGGFKITQIKLYTEAEVPGVSDVVFQQQAEAAKKGCPVSRALAGTEISLTARLIKS